MLDYEERHEPLFNLDLKRTETAIRSGRLDEAFNLLQASPERAHRDGQALTDRLAAAFGTRAAEHLAADRVEDARHDADRALRLAGRSTEVAELLQNVAAAETTRRGRQQLRNEVLTSAEQQLQVGAYSIGAKLLDGLSADQSASGAAAAERLGQAIEAKRVVVDESAQRIQASIDRGDFALAVRLIGKLRPDQRSHVRVESLIPLAVEPLVEAGMAELIAGRLDRAAAIADSLSWLGLPAAVPPAITVAGSPSYTELQQCLDRCQAARQHLAAHEFADAAAELNLLNRVIPNAAWIREAQSAVAEVLQHLNSVTAGPLGLLREVNPGSGSRQDSRPDKLPPNVLTSSAPAAFGNDHSSDHSILQVDGIGGLLLLRKDVVTVGTSASSAESFDVCLQTEGTTNTIRIRRDGDDYFAESNSPFGVNGQQVTRRLLTTGDTLAVGSRGRLRFVKPVAASGSAVLQITGSRMTKRDIRNIVLMSDSLLFGPNGSHFRLPDVEAPIVLHCGAAGYALRQMQTGGARSKPSTLSFGKSVVMNDVRFALVEA